MPDSYLGRWNLWGHCRIIPAEMVKSGSDAIETAIVQRHALGQHNQVLGKSLVYRGMDLRVSGTLTRHLLHFDIPLPASTESDLRNPDKAQLRADILAMRANGMSYRQIAREVGLHWTRVQQILRGSERPSH